VDWIRHFLLMVTSSKTEPSDENVIFTVSEVVSVSVTSSSQPKKRHKNIKLN